MWHLTRHPEGWLSVLPASPPTVLVAAPGRAQRVAGRSKALLLFALLMLLVGAHLVVRYQGPRWTSPLIVLDHLFDLALAVLLLVYSLAIGRCVGRPLRNPNGDPLSEGLAALGLGLGLLSTAILCAGFLRLYYGPIFLAAAVVLTIVLRAELLQILRETELAWQRWRRSGMHTAPDLSQRLVLLVLVLALLALWIDAMLPIGTGSLVDWDAPVYHLSALKLYLAAHRIVPLPDIPLANAPSGTEMLYLAGLFAGSDLLGKTLNVLLVILLCLATFAATRRHFGRQPAWLAPLLLGNVIWLITEVPATVTEFAAALLVLLGVSDLLAWLTGQEGGPTRRAVREAPGIHGWGAGIIARDRLLIRAGLLLGFAVAFKLINIAIVPVALITAGAGCLVLAQGSVARRLTWAVYAGVLLGLAMLLPLAPWLLKNLYFFHDALYPVAVQTSSSIGTAVTAGATATRPTLLSHLWWIITQAIAVVWNTVGPFSICLPAAPLLLRRPVERLAMLCLLLSVSCWLAFVPLYAEPRYYLAPIALADVLTGVTLYRLAEYLRLPRRATEAILAVYLLVHSLLLLDLAVLQLGKNGAIDVARGSVSAAAYLDAHIGPYQAIDWLNGHTPRDAEVVMLHSSLGYYLDRPYLNDWYGSRLLRVETPATRAAELQAWCAAGVRYAVLNHGDDHDAAFGYHLPSPLTWLRTPGLGIRTLYSANKVVVLQVSPCRARQA